jgi:hypothetical protein
MQCLPAPCNIERMEALAVVEAPELGPLTQELMDYWLRLRADRRMPSRRDLDPLDIPKLLPGVLLLDVEHETHRLRFRLVGTRITELYGSDFTGQYLDNTFFGRHRDKVVDDYEQVMREGIPHHCWMEFTNRDGLEFKMERLILPLSRDGCTVDKLIALLDIKLLRSG